MPAKIAVIGAGMTGTAVFFKLVEAIEKNELPAHQIDIFERSKDFGPGLAYSMGSDNLLLNRTTRRMYVTNKSDFLDWVNQQRFDVLRYPVEDQFLPRRVFGQFLRHLFNQAMSRAKILGCKVNLVAKSVDGLRQLDDQYILTTQSEKHGPYAHLFVCNGNDVTADPYNLKDCPGYHPTSYPISNFFDFEDDARVGIIGSRLTAVDLVIELYNRKPTLNFTMLSRSSGLPYCAGLPFSATSLTQFNPQNIDNHIAKDGYLSLKDAARLVNKDLRSVGVKKGILEILNSTDEGGLSGNTGEICKIREVLLAASEYLPYAWQRMAAQDQSVFFSRYKRPWILARLTMPRNNATKMQHLIDSGVLAVTPGITDISHQANGVFEVTYQNGETRHFDHIINGTGIKRHCDKMSSPLVCALLDGGLCTRHPYGGVIIDPETHFTLNAQGEENASLSVLGQLAVGNYFMTNSVDGIAVQIDRAIAGYVVKHEQMLSMA